MMYSQMVASSVMNVNSSVSFSRASTHSSVTRYFSITRSMKRSMAALSGFSRPGLWARNMRAHIIGVSVSETIAETTTAMVSVSANSRNMRPTSPVMNSSGMKTAISDSVSEMTVKPISLAPRNAACIGPSPSSMWRTMFSIMTMASSTTKPVPMVSAISERLSSE